MPLHKLINALTAICVLSVQIHGQSAEHNSSQDVTRRAQRGYYNLRTHGFNGFKATIEPNWEVILAHTATPKNLEVFRAVRFSMIAEANGAVTVEYEIEDREKRRLESTMKQIQKNMQGLVGGFFDTWRMFMVSSAFETPGQIRIEEHVDSYRLSYSLQWADVVLTTTTDFVITEWKLTSPSVKRTIRPQFQKTGEGLLLTGYIGDSEPIGPGVRTTLNFSIEYSAAGGMKLPHKLRINGMHGSEAVAAELTFTQYVLNPAPTDETTP